MYHRLAKSHRQGRREKEEREREGTKREQRENKERTKREQRENKERTKREQREREQRERRHLHILTFSHLHICASSHLYMLHEHFSYTVVLVSCLGNFGPSLSWIYWVYLLHQTRTGNDILTKKATQSESTTIKPSVGLLHLARNLPLSNTQPAILEKTRLEPCFSPNSVATLGGSYGKC